MYFEFIGKFQEDVVFWKERVVLGYQAGYCEVADAGAVGGL